MKITLKIDGIAKGSIANLVAEKLIDAFHDESRVNLLGANVKVLKYETSHYEMVTTQPLSQSKPDYHPPKDRTAEFEIYIVD